MRVRLTTYKVVMAPFTQSSYHVYRKKWWSPLWQRCSGLHYDQFKTVDDAKKAIPLYDRGNAYWVGTMVDLTAERIGAHNNETP